MPYANSYGGGGEDFNCRKGEGTSGVSVAKKGTGEFLWRGSLLPLGCEAVVNPASAVRLTDRGGRVWECCALQREQAPSPQKQAVY
jgi:hypothetical protein